MHFAYPGRKASPPPYPTKHSQSILTRLRRHKTWRSMAMMALGLFTTLYLLSRLLSRGERTYIPAGTPKAVIVTMFGADSDPTWKQSIMDNRKDYASRHGYATFFTNTSSYSVGHPTTPKSWGILPSLRHAMKLFPHTPHVFYLAPSALIMTPALSLEQHILAPSRIESIMLTDRSVVPPDSVIKTYSHLKARNIDLILTQDHAGLSRDSMLLRNGEWARYLVDAWFDPLYRSYNFQKAERHALEHIVQWHGTVLSRLALVPQRTINSYVDAKAADQAAEEAAYADGDFVANFAGCDRREVKSELTEAQRRSRKQPPARTEDACAREMATLITRWREIVDREGRS